VHEDHCTITVITFENHRQASRQTFLRREPVVSTVLPEFTLSLDEILEE